MYKRQITGRAPGERPYTLLDFFPDDFLVLMDESHVSLPQIRGMYEGDMSRKRSLVDHGFRLPSALDNRPLRFQEFMELTTQRVYVSATPGPFEVVNSRPDNRGCIPVHGNKETGLAPIRLRQLRIVPSPTDQPVEDFDVTRKGNPVSYTHLTLPTSDLV